MDEYNRRFEDLAQRYEPVIRRACHAYSRRMPWDERYNTALIGLMYADREYRSGMNYDKFVESCIYEALALYCKKRNIGREYFSLNARAFGPDGSVEFIELLRDVYSDWDLRIVLRDFMRRQDALSRLIGEYLACKADVEDISADLCFALESIEARIEDMRNDFLWLYGENWQQELLCV